MLLTYVLSIIIGGFIGFILAGKVPLIMIFIISFMVGALIGYIGYKIKQKKAEREWAIIRANIMLNGIKEEEL